MVAAAQPRLQVAAEAAAEQASPRPYATVALEKLDNSKLLAAMAGAASKETVLAAARAGAAERAAAEAAAGQASSRPYAAVALKKVDDSQLLAAMAGAASKETVLAAARAGAAEQAAAALTEKATPRPYASVALKKAGGAEEVEVQEVAATTHSFAQTALRLNSHAMGNGFATAVLNAEAEKAKKAAGGQRLADDGPVAPVAPEDILREVNDHEAIAPFADVGAGAGGASAGGSSLREEVHARGFTDVKDPEAIKDGLEDRPVPAHEKAVPGGKRTPAQDLAAAGPQGQTQLAALGVAQGWADEKQDAFDDLPEGEQAQGDRQVDAGRDADPNEIEDWAGQDDVVEASERTTAAGSTGLFDFFASINIVAVLAVVGVLVALIVVKRWIMRATDGHYEKIGGRNGGAPPPPAFDLITDEDLAII